MPLLKELGTAARQRRREMGLSQQQVAALVELSRATINELESGKLKDLSANRIERIANELGFAVGVVGTRRPKDRSPLEAAARVASVPYARNLPSSVLFECLRDGTVAPRYLPHLRTLLDEAPVAVLANVVDEMREAHDIAPAQTWARMRALARVLQCDRALWQ